MCETRFEIGIKEQNSYYRLDKMQKSMVSYIPVDRKYNSKVIFHLQNHCGLEGEAEQ